MWGGNKERTGSYKGAKIKPPFVLKWEYVWGYSGAGLLAAHRMPLLVADERLYVGRGIDYESRFWCFNSRTGQLIWQHQVGECQYLFENNSVFFSPHQIGVALKFNLVDRSISWSLSVNGGYPPMPVGDSIYLSPSWDESTTIFCLDQRTGSINWQMEFVGGSLYSSFHQDVLFVPGEHLLALRHNKAYPEVKWIHEYPTGSPTHHANVAIANERVYSPVLLDETSMRLEVLDLESANLIWDLDLEACSDSPACVVEKERIYLWQIDACSTLYALSDLGGSGSLLWKKSYGSDPNKIYMTSLMAANEVVYLGLREGSDSSIRALDAESGAELWSAWNDSLIIDGLAYSDGLVYGATYVGTFCYGKPISVHLAVDKEAAARNDVLTYVITLNSYGGADASVTLVESLPAEVEFVGASDGGVLSGRVVAWNGLAVTANSLRDVTLTVRVKSDLPVGTHVLEPTAFITYAGDPDYTDMESEVAATTVTVPPPASHMVPLAGRIRVFPNPFDPDAAVRGTVKFEVSGPTNVRLYTSRGLKVWTGEIASSGIIEWDGKNEAGKRVSPAVYLWVAEGEDWKERGTLIVE